MEEFLLDKNSDEPMYYQLYSYLKKCIVDGEFRTGSTIPSEKEMIELYGLSRITIRRAVDELERDGLLKKSRGKGSVVLEAKPLTDKNLLHSFSESATMRGERITYVIIRAGVQEANIKVSDALGVPLGERVLGIKRLLLINGRIAGLAEAYVRYSEKLHNLFDTFDENTSLYAKLSENGIYIDCADETIEALIPPAEVRRALFIEENEPVIYTENLSYNAANEAVEFTIAYFIFNKFKYSFHIKRR